MIDAVVSSLSSIGFEVCITQFAYSCLIVFFELHIIGISGAFSKYCFALLYMDTCYKERILKDGNSLCEY